MRTPLVLYPLLLLGLSCLLALGASRSLGNYHKLKPEAPVLSIMDQSMTIQESQQPAVVVPDDAYAFVRGRMDMQSFNDYPGSGANNRHDPKTPGRP